MDWMAIIIAMSVPSAITGFCFWCLEKRIEKRNKELDAKEAAREENEILMVKSIGAAIALGEAAALALKNGYTNGETEAALEYARSVKHEQKDFLQRQAIGHLY